MVATAMLLGSTVAMAQPRLTPEERAAAPLYQEGRALFKAKRYPEALSQLSKAWGIVKNDSLRFYLGLTYAALDRCPESLPFLTQLRGRLGSSQRAFERQRKEAELRCRQVVAQAELDSWRCHTALEVLADLKGKAADLTRDDARLCLKRFDTRRDEGRRAAKRHGEARALMERGRYREAAKAARDSLGIVKSPAAAAVLAISLSKTRQCAQALVVLGPHQGKFETDDADAVATIQTRCLLTLARRDVKAGNCKAAMPRLEALNGRLKGADERWRAAKRDWCAPRATEFLTNTTDTKAAHSLFLAARQASMEGRFPRAAELFGKALKLSDQAVMRREYAQLLIRTSGCDAAVATLEKIPEDDREPDDTRLLEACEAYPPGAGLTGEQRHRYMAGVLKGLDALGQGETGQAAKAWESVVAFGGSPGLARALADLLFDVRRCDQFFKAAERATRLGAPPAHLSKKRVACGGSAVVKQDPRVPPSLVVPEPDPPSRPYFTWGLASLITGAVLAGGAVPFIVDYAGLQGSVAHSVEEKTKNEQRGLRDSALAYTLGGVGLGLVVTGAVLLALPEPAPDGVIIQPALGLGAVGIWGRF